MSRRAILVGPVVRPQWLRSLMRGRDLSADADRVIAIDSGLDVCLESGVKPDFAVGDWDSLRNQVLLEAVEHATLPRKKDRSDLGYALEAARRAGAEEVLAVGVTGGGLDYHLANLYDLARSPLAVQAVDEAAQYYFLTARGPARKLKLLAKKKGQRISVLPLGGPALGVTLRGLEYPLRNAKLECSSQGLSNRALVRQVEISVKKGSLVVIIPRA